VYVLPSFDEPFPMTLLEALSEGVPSVCTTSCGIAGDLAMTGAALVAEPSAPSLASAVGQLLRDAQLRNRTSEAARAASRAQYGMAAVAIQLERLYMRIAEGDSA
jgi:glycosyltransferase involved in cell wall biosynthesis